MIRGKWSVCVKDPDIIDIPGAALGWHKDGTGAALATVVQTWGSAPRRVGSQLAISGQGAFIGSVSGGCVEGAVVTEALEALGDGRPRVLEYGVADEDAFSAGLACGGTIRVLLEPVGAALPTALLEEIVARRAARDPFAYLVNTQTWERRLSAGPDDALAGDIAPAMRRDRSAMAGDWFIHANPPPLTLLIVGAVHIAQPLAAMARMTGYDTTIIDPRTAFASRERFPYDRLIDAYPDEAFADLPLDARTAVVTLSHDPKIDDPAILAALGSEIFYLGCLGSPKTHAKRVARLTKAGVPEAALARIHAPVGLDIGSATPAEIAVSVMAELTSALRRRG